MRKTKLMTLTALLVLGSFADIKVSDVKVFSGYPWKEVVVGYTISGNDTDGAIIRLTAKDKAVNKSYTVVAGSSALTGDEVSEGKHMLRWNAAKAGAKFSSSNVVFTVAVVSYGGVQLWENGPYWAECNVGAKKPEEYGYHFWWGDTIGYKRNDHNTRWISVKTGDYFSFSGENCPTDGNDNYQLQSLGYIDSTGNLTATHDAATVHLGAPWRMPTDEEFDDLICKCDTTWTTCNGTKGRLVKGRGAYATKSIFLPAAGWGDDLDRTGVGSYGHYMSSTPYSDGSGRAWILDFTSSYFRRGDYGPRWYGQSIRPIRGWPR